MLTWLCGKEAKIHSFNCGIEKHNYISDETFCAQSQIWWKGFPNFRQNLFAFVRGWQLGGRGWHYWIAWRRQRDSAENPGTSFTKFDSVRRMFPQKLCVQNPKTFTPIIILSQLFCLNRELLNGNGEILLLSVIATITVRFLRDLSLICWKLERRKELRRKTERKKERKKESKEVKRKEKKGNKKKRKWERKNKKQRKKRWAQRKRDKGIKEEGEKEWSKNMDLPY